MRRQLLPAVRMVLVMTLLVGIAYPLVLVGIAQGLFGAKADGSLVTNGDQVVGSALLGQSFTQDRYFWSRPSAAGAGASGAMGPSGAPVDPTDLGVINSGGSNLGPTNETLIATVQQRIDAYRSAHGLGTDTPVPVDAVTASGSGVDPQISIANARLQAPRVAAARAMSVDEVNALVDTYTAGRVFGFLGEPGVNVLALNRALDGRT